MSARFLLNSSHTCNWCDKPAKYEICYMEHPHRDFYCSVDHEKGVYYCDERRKQKESPQTQEDKDNG